MSLLKSFASAFLMYSRIPMPRVEWKEENRRYALCFFPLIGVVIGLLITGWYIFCEKWQVSFVLFGAVSVCIPVLVTGGIHLDGYMDVHDAMACMGNREKKLQVMKDSRVGAFAVIHMCMYFLVQFACICELYRFNERQYVVIFAGTFVSSRAYSGLAAVHFKNASGKGSLMNFTKPAHKNRTTVIEILYIAGVSAAMLAVSVPVGAGAIAGAALAMIHYRIFSYREFDGITGDLAGYFLQVSELLQLITMLLSAMLV
ncbi:MAG: adenosylcobinamide-GDP ribazoletransferase [Lachnospiraceae bacterium]|nr:adenosylcobinamide-GDP ribazoletransferase [Lachnospiraceae bacterium]